MIGCAASSPPLTHPAVSNRNSRFLSGGSGSGSVSPAAAFPPRGSSPTLSLPPRRFPAGVRAAYASAAAERESEYTSTGGGYSSYSYSSSSSYSHDARPVSAFAAPAAPQSLYDVLGLPASATSQEIKAAYRRLARSCHPDGGGGAEQFMRVHAAYATLSDPDKRAEYDRGLAMPVASAGARRARAYQHQAASYPGPGGSAPSSSPGYSSSPGFQSGFGRRTWETDQCW